MIYKRKKYGYKKYMDCRPKRYRKKGHTHSGQRCNDQCFYWKICNKAKKPVVQIDRKRYIQRSNDEIQIREEFQELKYEKNREEINELSNRKRIWKLKK